MIKRSILLTVMAVSFPIAAQAQIGLPSIPSLPQLPSLPGPGLPEVPVERDILPRSLDRLSSAELVKALREARLDRLTSFVRDNRRQVIADENGNPAVRGVIVVAGTGADSIEQATAAGFGLVDEENIVELGLSFVRLAPPKGMNELDALQLARRILPNFEVSLDHYYLPSGHALGSSTPAKAAAPSVPTGSVGIIDGGLGRSRRLPAAEQRGFAPGAPKPSDHASALASLVAGGAPQRPAASGVRLYIADVYGTGPQGGTATTIARALGWLAKENVPVAVISLVGPDNPLLRRAVRAAQGRGVIIVAAVGNDGPAAPPAYPASMRGVLAVTGTDTKGRTLPEAGRALHVDFAAPASGIKAHDARGRMTNVRGTSFAAPLVAGRLALHYPKPDISRIESAVRRLMSESRDLGERGRDDIFGHGLVCGECGAR